MANYKLIVEYDGTNYHGFQVQPKISTIQGEIESVLTKLAQSDTRVTGAGRTDAGVHALNQVINFHSNLTVPVDKLKLAFNSLLPKDIRVKQATQVDQQFHARFDAIEKSYFYRIEQGDNASAFSRNYCWWIRNSLAWDKMIIASEKIIGKHDFAGFTASGSDVHCTIRTLKDVQIKRQENGVELRFTADGFLYHMVRNLVGTLVEVGLSKREPDSIVEILDSKDRGRAGVTAPAQGLFLESIRYT